MFNSLVELKIGNLHILTVIIDQFVELLIYCIIDEKSFCYFFGYHEIDLIQVLLVLTRVQRKVLGQRKTHSADIAEKRFKIYKAHL